MGLRSRWREASTMQKCGVVAFSPLIAVGLGVTGAVYLVIGVTIGAVVGLNDSCIFSHRVVRDYVDMANERFFDTSSTTDGSHEE